MKMKDALKIISRQAPCPHENADTRLGNGQIWAKCEDCGLTFDRAQWPDARQAAKEFDDAIQAIAEQLK